MRNSHQYKQRLPLDDILNAEARAVIDADFEEIHPTLPRKNFIARVKTGWVWIKQRLHRG